MKIRLSELRKIIREEVSRSVNETAGSGDPEAVFMRLMKTSRKSDIPAIADAWDSLKSGTSFPDVAKELYDATRLNIAWIAKKQQGGPGLGDGPFDPDKLAAVDAAIDASTMTGDDLLAAHAAEQEMQSRPRSSGRPPWPGDPNDPAERIYEPGVGWKRVRVSD